MRIPVLLFFISHPLWITALLPKLVPRAVEERKLSWEEAIEALARARFCHLAFVDFEIADLLA